MEQTRLARNANILGIAGLGDVVLGLVLYWLLMDNAWIRSTAIPSVALIAAGLGVCVLALYLRRSAATIVTTSLAALLSVGFALSIFVITRLPEPQQAPDIGMKAPSFTLANHKGEQVALADLHTNGPALLVFYRGHW